MHPPSESPVRNSHKPLCLHQIAILIFPLSQTQASTCQCIEIQKHPRTQPPQHLCPDPTRRTMSLAPRALQHRPIIRILICPTPAFRQLTHGNSSPCQWTGFYPCPKHGGSFHRSDSGTVRFDQPNSSRQTSTRRARPSHSFPLLCSLCLSTGALSSAVSILLLTRVAMMSSYSTEYEFRRAERCVSV